MDNNPFCDCQEVEALIMLAFEAVPLGSELAERLEQVVLQYCPVCGRAMQEVYGL